MTGATIRVAAAKRNTMNASPLPGFVSRTAASTPAATMIRPTPVRTSRVVGGRMARPAGRSAMRAARSVWQRDADTWAVRASRSSSVSRPCSHAAVRMRFTCSRATAWDTCRRSPPPAHAAAPGAAGDGSCPAEPLAGREATSMKTPRSQKSRQATEVKVTICAAVAWGRPGASRNATMPGRNIAYSIREAIFVARHGSRGDLAPVSSAGMSAMTSASSA